MPSLRGRRIVPSIAALTVTLLLAACVGPLTRSEAEGIAMRRMARFCAQACGAYHITGAQQMRDRWLVDFETPRHKLGVLVDDGGTTQVTVWDK
jgi:hypothetical protein